MKRWLIAPALVVTALAGIVVGRATVPKPPAAEASPHAGVGEAPPPGALAAAALAMSASRCSLDEGERDALAEAIARRLGKLSAAPVIAAAVPDAEKAVANRPDDKQRSEELQRVHEQAAAVVDRSIASGAWTQETSLTLRGLMWQLTPEARDDLMRKVSAALADHRIKLDYRGPVF
jgi:hypothetical protein